MSLRANGRAAEDLLTLIRALKDPSDLMGHLENIAKGSAKLAEDIDAVKAREDAVAQREEAAKVEHDRQVMRAIALNDQDRDLDHRQERLDRQGQDLALSINNHGADVAAFQAAKASYQDAVESKRLQLAALQAELDKAHADHAQRKQALDDREVFLNGIEAALNERAKRIAEAVK